MEIQDMLERANNLYSDGLRCYRRGNFNEALLYLSVARSYFCKSEEPEGIQECDELITSLTEEHSLGDFNHWVNLGDNMASHVVDYENLNKPKPSILEVICKKLAVRL